MSAFKVGDVVQLKSGSPEMTVIDMNQEGSDVKCMWFVIDNSARTQSIPAVALMPVELTNP
ncbi:YodC family protein [Alcaligenes nematophilus]|uniref:YodC family protein n=1 Tax=Alcaligenes nematophilus TaxID=2994643 RepID=UPI003D1F7C13